MTVTKQQVVRRAQELGVTVAFHKDSGRSVRGEVFHEIVLTAPESKRFAGADVHERIVGSHVDGAPMETLYPSALDDMGDGVETCDDIECEWCHDELALSDE